MTKRDHELLNQVPLSDLEEAALWVLRNVVLPAREAPADDEEDTIDGRF